VFADPFAGPQRRPPSCRSRAPRGNRNRTTTWTTQTVEVRTGQIRPATREDLRTWLERFEDLTDVAFALEATTGWRFVVEEIGRTGARAHLAEPADARALRGPKRRPKTDRADARHLRDLLHRGQLPESWIPPPHMADLRARVRLRKALVDERTGWCQRMQATLFHHGQPRLRDLLTRETEHPR